jgi:hypothetical protein
VTETIREIALSAAEVQEILAQCGSSALLVGGQALALWAIYFDVEPVGVLSEKITSDADFIGNAELAEKLGRTLKWDLWRPNFDDATPQTAKLTRAVKGGVQQIDFLSGIIGLESQAIQTRAVEITLRSGISLRVLHPLDVLESRLQNLLSLPEKRDETGVAQANLAIAIAGRFLEQLFETDTGQRALFDAIERIAQIATNKRLSSVIVDYSLDLLAIVPVSKIGNSEFRTLRWPQITAAARKQTNKYRERAKRKSVSLNRKS